MAADPASASAGGNGKDLCAATTAISAAKGAM